MASPAPFVDVCGFPADNEPVDPTPRAAHHLIAAGWTHNRVLTTVEDILELNSLDIVLFDDNENAGGMELYVVPDDGTVMYRTPEAFHLMDGAGNYHYAWAMPLPLTVLRATA